MLRSAKAFCCSITSASHAIFVREGAEDTYDQVDEVPAVMRTRLLSLRAYDAEGMMLDAEVVAGMLFGTN